MLNTLGKMSAKQDIRELGRALIWTSSANREHMPQQFFVIPIGIAQNQVKHASQGINCLNYAFVEELPFCFLIPIPES
jgi:hypothetical protein